MPADEVTHGTDVNVSRVRTGPRHAAPRKPLFTRFHMPAGKAIALAAMPTAVLMGMGFTPTLARADDQPSSKSLTADEYQDCVSELEGDASASPSPSPSESASEDADDGAKDDAKDGAKDDAGEPSPSATSDPDAGSGEDGSGKGGSASPGGQGEDGKGDAGGDEASDEPSASPSASEDDGNLLEDVGGAVTGLLGGGDENDEDSDSDSSTPSASPSASASASKNAEDSSQDAGKDASDAVKDTTDKVTEATDKATDTVKDTTEAAGEATGKATDEATDGPKDGATASPSPSESTGTDAEDCPVATDAQGDVDNKVPVADKPWTLKASSLTLKGAQYKGVVEVKTASGKTKKVLKYVITEGTDIGDLHQIVNENGKTYHVQAGQGTTSTITGGETVMYTESISGNLYGLIPITFDPVRPPPLDIPLIYFTNVTVTQAAQFGGTLHIPGMHQYTE